MTDEHKNSAFNYVSGLKRDEFCIYIPGKQNKYISVPLQNMKPMLQKIHLHISYLW